MNSRKTLFLIVLAVSAGGFVLWDHFKGMPTEEREAKGRRLIDIDQKTVTRVELVRSNQTIVLEKTGDDWDLKQPLTARASAGAVDSILAELEFAERVRTLAGKDLQGMNVTEFGFETPRMTIKLQTKKGPVTLIVGNDTPTKDAVYVQVEGRKSVSVVRQSDFDRTSQSVESLRNRAALEFISTAATRLEVKTLPDRVIELTKSATAGTEPRWSVSRPLIARADQTKVSELLTTLNSLRIQDFVSEEPKDVHTYHLEEPEREVTVFTGESGKTLLLGRPVTNDVSKVYAKLKGGNSIFTVSADAAGKFAMQVNDVRDAHAFVFHPDRVKTIELIRGTDQLVLKRGDHAWQITAPVSYPADEAAVGDLLRFLAGLKISQFTTDVTTDLDKYGLATPVATVTLLGAGTNTLGQLLIGANDASNSVRYVKRADEPFIYGVETNVLDHLPLQYGACRSRDVFNFQPAQITKFTAGTTTLARDDNNKWKLIAPTQGIVDTDAVDAILSIFARLRADAFGRPKTGQDTHLGYTIQATIGDTTHWLSIAADGRAAASSVELTFTLAEPVAATLQKRFLAEPKADTAKPAVAAPAPSQP